MNLTRVVFELPPPNVALLNSVGSCDLLPNPVIHVPNPDCCNLTHTQIKEQERSIRDSRFEKVMKDIKGFLLTGSVSYTRTIVIQCYIPT